MTKRLLSAYLRILALIRVLTSRNFILISNIAEFQKEGKAARRSTLLRRTDYTNESDFLTMKGALLSNFDVIQIEDKHHRELQEEGIS